MGALILFFDFGPLATSAVVDRWADVLMLDLDPIGRLELQSEVIA